MLAARKLLRLTCRIAGADQDDLLVGAQPRFDPRRPVMNAGVFIGVDILYREPSVIHATRNHNRIGADTRSPLASFKTKRVA